MAATFEGKVILITGASEGIGRALALKLAAQGAKLAVSARSENRLIELVGECERRGSEAIAIPCDVSVEDQCQRLVRETVERFGGLDVLVANAGRTMWATLESLEDTRVLEDIMAVNYFGAVYCTRAALPHLRARKGRFVAQ